MATREELKALMEAQQKQFSDLLNALVSKNAAPVANNSELYAQINGQIPDFRFGDFVLKDGQALSEDMKDLFSDSQGLQRLFSKGPRVRGRMYTPLHRHHVRQYRSTPRDHNVNGDHLFGSRPVDNEI
uniref:Uncharacterized protein n=1 Tax=Globodera rostochiensis TaxID=31243 RepID=A0A914I3K0_GLORO